MDTAKLYGLFSYNASTECINQESFSLVSEVQIILTLFFASSNVDPSQISKLGSTLIDQPIFRAFTID